MVLNISTVSLLYARSVPLSYRDIPSFPCIVIMNIMASRIYRNVNSGAFQITPSGASCNTWGTLRFDRDRSDAITVDETGSGSDVTGGDGLLIIGKKNESTHVFGEQEV